MRCFFLSLLSVTFFLSIDRIPVPTIPNEINESATLLSLPCMFVWLIRWHTSRDLWAIIFVSLSLVLSMAKSESAHHT